MTSLPEFSDIYEEHHRRVLSLCRYLLKSEEAAEDATHEVFVKVQHRLDTYDPALPLSNWILKIASNHCVDIIRKRGTERRIFGPDSEDVEPPAVGPGPLANLLAEERGDRVRKALDRLPEKYRLPLVLTYYNEFSYEEVGGVLGVGRNTVATLLHRGKRLLRSELLSGEESAS